MEANSSLTSDNYLKPVSPLQVHLDDDFWRPRMQILSESTIKNQYQLLAETGRLQNLHNAANQSLAPYQGYFFNDSDVYKWLEAAVWIQAQASSQDTELDKAINDTINLIASAQQPDGYLDSYFMGEKASQRWTNLKDMHEMYCAGHLIQAAIADHRSRQQTGLLTVARRLADHIVNIFGPGKRPGVPGHPEIELALVDLYRETGHRPYLELAQYFIDQRGKGIIGGSPYHIDSRPIREMDQLVGHAVRAMYLCAGAADVYELTGDQSLLLALTRLWNRMVNTQIYVTGGLGARHEGESFGDAYELPNARAYTETCAAIGSILWNQRMFRLTRDTRYADLLEWTLYNAVLPGISLDLNEYFYENPLSDQGTHRRAKWFPCACCPPNMARLLAMLPGYIYATGETNGIPDIYIYGYAQNTAAIPLPGGGFFTLSQNTKYPWQGKIEISVLNSDHLAPVSIHLRIPAWVDGSTISLSMNDHPQDSPIPGSWATITRNFDPGDRITLNLPMQARWLSSHPLLVENTHQSVLTRGPLVYCLESADNPEVDLRLVEAVSGGSISERSSSLPGIIGLSYPALEYAVPEAWQGRLYLHEPPKQTRPRSFEALAVPYFAWANRQPGQMQVWITYGRS